jgi:AbiV family abortive infection protein
MTNQSRWTLNNGTTLPDPGVRIFITVPGDEIPPITMPKFEPSADLARRAKDTYRSARANAHALIEDAIILVAAGRHARAFALAATALEEVGKSQYAADVSTGFIPGDDFNRVIRDHTFKSRYANRDVQFAPVMLPIVYDDGLPEALFNMRNDSPYSSSTNQALDSDFETDAKVLIDYVSAWLTEIESQEYIAERIGTKAFLK